VYADLARKSRHALRWRDRLLVWFMPPGWQPAGEAGQHWRKPTFDIARMRRYDPPMSAAARWFVGVHFVAVLLGSVALLWFAPTMPAAELATLAAAVLVVLWLVGAVMQDRLGIGRALLIESAAIVLLAWSLAARGGESLALPAAEAGTVFPAEATGSAEVPAQRKS
jgi:hypothetical protein